MKERKTPTALYFVLVFIVSSSVLSSAHILLLLPQNHQFNTYHIYSHPTYPSFSSKLPIFFFFSPSTHTHTPKTHPTTLSHLSSHTGTSTTSPTPSAPNLPEATAASNARKTNVARKSHPLKLSLWSTFTRRLPSGKICKCYLNRMDDW